MKTDPYSEVRQVGERPMREIEDVANEALATKLAFQDGWTQEVAADVRGNGFPVWRKTALFAKVGLSVDVDRILWRHYAIDDPVSALELLTLEWKAHEKAHERLK